MWRLTLASALSTTHKYDKLIAIFGIGLLYIHSTVKKSWAAKENCLNYLYVGVNYDFMFVKMC